MQLLEGLYVSESLDEKSEERERQKKGDHRHKTRSRSRSRLRHSSPAASVLTDVVPSSLPPAASSRAAAPPKSTDPSLTVAPSPTATAPSSPSPPPQQKSTTQPKAPPPFPVTVLLALYQFSPTSLFDAFSRNHSPTHPERTNPLPRLDPAPSYTIITTNTAPINSSPFHLITTSSPVAKPPSTTYASIAASISLTNSSENTWAARIKSSLRNLRKLSEPTYLEDGTPWLRRLHQSSSKPPRRGRIT